MLRISFSMFNLFRLWSDFVECTRNPASLGHFERVDPLFKSNITSPFWPSDISKSKNAWKQGTAGHKSTLKRWNFMICVNKMYLCFSMLSKMSKEATKWFFSNTMKFNASSKIMGLQFALKVSWILVFAYDRLRFTAKIGLFFYLASFLLNCLHLEVLN